VVKREDVEERDGVVVLGATLRELGIRAGLNIRRRGENAAAQAVVVTSGNVINAAIAGAAAAFGRSELTVRRRVRVSIVTTGDELVPVEEQPEAWQLRDSNAVSLRAMLTARAWVQVVHCGRVRDDSAAIAAAVKAATEQSDAVVLTGGVSMGDRDFVPRVVGELGARIVFHKLPQRPGRPMLGAVMPDGVPVFGLPGNPVSVMVTARRLMLPVLAQVAGAGAHVESGVRRTVANPDDARIDLWWHRSVCEREDGKLEWVGGRGSGDVVAAAASSGFAEVPPREAGAGPWSYFAW
jgi:molybdopterin molybdotransferase